MSKAWVKHFSIKYMYMYIEKNERLNDRRKTTYNVEYKYDQI